MVSENQTRNMTVTCRGFICLYILLTSKLMSDISNMIEDFIIKVLFQVGTLYQNLLLKYNLNIESSSGEKELHHV